MAKLALFFVTLNSFFLNQICSFASKSENLYSKNLSNIFLVITYVNWNIGTHCSHSVTYKHLAVSHVPPRIGDTLAQLVFSLVFLMSILYRIVYLRWGIQLFLYFLSLHIFF